jgi:argininosuccinate synthase
MRLWHGTAVATGRFSERSLYSHALATYGEGDQFDQSAAQGFIKLWSLPLEVQAQAQLLGEPGDPLRLARPDEHED